ncbi:MAG: hypothetical protein M0R22_00075 [Dehalococcoidia bacterium]|jgi:hypothetical protein|nr:hypothetical protein [Dehalococcoidia bacterium]
MSDVKQVEVEIDVTISVPVKVRVNVDLEELRTGKELMDETVSRVVSVSPVYKVLAPKDFDDSIVDMDDLDTAIFNALGEFGIDVEELQAENWTDENEIDDEEECDGDCDCDEPCEDCDCDRDYDEKEYE